jgi:pyruvate dehydrogenase E2 component (dihydrolipoyllysine-residue acetyltransferase)
MVQEVVMPQMGESITEGTVIRWIKKPGDRVRRDEPLFEISTDKVDTEIPSPGDGVLSEIKVKEGETVPVNTVVCILTEAGAATAAAPKAPPAPPKQAAPPPAPPRVAAPATPRPPAAPAARTAAPAPPSAPHARPAPPPAPAAETDDEGPHRSSPLVRKIAQEHGVDIAQVKGTGTGGRVTKKDILDFISLGESGQTPAATEEPPAGAEPATEEGEWDESGVRVEPVSIMRAKIGEHMVHSRHTSAHVTTFHEVDLTGVARAREATKAAILKDTGVKLTFLPFVLKAAVSALRDHPVINASLVGKEIHFHRSVHLGIAVAIDDGLIVPVIRSAEEKSILGLARAVQDLAERARTKRLTPQEVQGGTFTVTNFGSFGSLFATPIINQPQVAILGVGAAVKRPVVLPESDAIAVRTQMVLSMSFDHRLIDGATADRYLAQVRKTLEQGPFDLS